MGPWRQVTESKILIAVLCLCRLNLWQTLTGEAQMPRVLLPLIVRMHHSKGPSSVLPVGAKEISEGYLLTECMQHLLPTCF